MTATTNERVSNEFNCSAYAQVVAHELNLKETELDQLLQGTNLPRHVLYPGSDIHMNDQQFLLVVANALNMSPDPRIGLRCAQHIKPSVHGPVGFLAIDAPDLYACLAAPEEFAPLRLPIVKMALSFETNWLCCELKITQEVDPDSERVLLEAVAITVQSSIEAYLARRFNRGRFEFAFDRPDYHQSYRHYFHSAVEFGAAKNQLRIPSEYAHEAKPGRDPHRYIVAHNLCAELLEQIPQASLDTASRVRQLLLSHSVGAITEEDVARALYISKRTLARRLDQQKTSYREQRELLLAELADRYLRDPSLSVEAVGLLLGYHDAANFRRAYKRWHGLTPSQFREQIGASAS